MNVETPDAEEASASGSWRPLLLIIPLRLGLTTINKVYLPAVQVFIAFIFIDFQKYSKFSEVL